MTKIRQWSILTAVAVLVVFAAGWFLMVKPQQTKSSSLRSEAASQVESNQVLQTQIDALDAEQKNLPQQQRALQRFTTQVPNDAAEPTIIRQLQAAASGAGVNLVSLTPGAASEIVAATPVVTAAPTPTASASTTVTGSSTSTTPAAGATTLAPAAPAGSQLVQLPLVIGVTGSYPNMETFFQSVEKLPRSILVTGWSMCPDVTGNAAASTSSGTAASCTLPATPSNVILPAGTLGATLSAYVFYAPPAGTVTPASQTLATTPSTTTTTTPSPATTPTAATSAAAG
jgi:Tfp pilus assembly protein PilO